MSKYDNQDGLNGSSESILVKNDSNLDTSTVQIDSRMLEAYDLEVQKPSERAKIISDNAFFKKLSYSFYSESMRNSKSYSTLPKHYDANVPSPKEQKKASNYPTSEPLSKAILHNLNSPLQSESKINGSIEHQNGIKAFKIKTLQNFYLPAGMAGPKAKPTTPLNKSKQNIEPVKTTDKKERPRKVSVKLEPSTPKQENKSNSPNTYFEKLVKGADPKSPLPATKMSPKLQFIDKSSPQKTSELIANNAGSSNGFESSSPNIASKIISPKTTKLVLLPAGRFSESKKEDRAGSNMNTLVAKDTAARLNQLITSRAVLKKNIA